MGELEFGRKLRALRHERNETLEDVSAATGLSVAMLSRVERGQRLPSPDSVEVLAQHFGLPTEKLMREAIASRIVNSYGREWEDSAGLQPPMNADVRIGRSPRADVMFSALPMDALFDEDVVRDSLADAVRVAEVALESAMRAVRRAQASGDPRQVEEAERVLERLRRAIG